MVASPAGPAAPRTRRMDLVDIYAFLRSNWRIIAGWTVAAVTVALVYAFTSTPLYTATADLALDSRKIQAFKNNEQVVGDNSLDSSQVESEVEILRSESIALAVVKDQKLIDDPDFVDTRPGLFCHALRRRSQSRSSARASRSAPLKAISAYGV